jgi:hypothetical protein
MSGFEPRDVRCDRVLNEFFITIIISIRSEKATSTCLFIVYSERESDKHLFIYCLFGARKRQAPVYLLSIRSEKATSTCLFIVETII